MAGAATTRRGVPQAGSWLPELLRVQLLPGSPLVQRCGAVLQDALAGGYLSGGSALAGCAAHMAAG